MLRSTRLWYFAMHALCYVQHVCGTSLCTLQATVSTSVVLRYARVMLHSTRLWYFAMHSSCYDQHVSCDDDDDDHHDDEDNDDGDDDDDDADDDDDDVSMIITMVMMMMMVMVIVMMMMMMVMMMMTMVMVMVMVMMMMMMDADDSPKNKLFSKTAMRHFHMLHVQNHRFAIAACWFSTHDIAKFTTAANQALTK